MFHPLFTLRNTVLLPLIGLASLGALGQRAFPGRPLGLRDRTGALPAPPVFMQPEVDAAALLAEDADRLLHGVKGRYRFGVEHATDLDVIALGAWHTTGGGEHVCRAVIECPGALGIGITFSRYVMPPGARVFLYNELGEVLGAYTAQSHPGHAVLGVQPLRGSRITVEYNAPPERSGQGELTIGQVVHVYRSPWKGFDRDLGDSGPCNINTICPEGDQWRPEIRSVALILAGGGTCTGQLLNNCNHDSIPYFLSANHCLAGGSDPATWVFRFLWESPTCDPTANGPTGNTISGSTQLVASAASDVLLLQLDEQPPPSFNAYYNGWDRSGMAPTSGTCIHHPMGDIKKISHDNDGQDAMNIDVGNGPADCWHVAAWDAGTTEPGSSGSGLWDQHHRIVGQLYGGQAECANNVNDYFGRFDVSFPLLEPWLGSCGDTLNGLDPGQAGAVVANDAAITSIVNVDAQLCNVDTIRPVVTLKNNGTSILSNVVIEYTVLGGAGGSLPWEGLLAPLQTANVVMPPIPITAGEQTLVVRTTLPNAQPDEMPGNDADTLQFIANLPGTPVSLLLTPDNYGEDISWALYNASGMLLQQGGPYPNGSTATIEALFCLGDGCYTFEITDVFGDGICCAEGNGQYVITSAFGDHVVSDGQYGAGEVREFCLEGVGMVEAPGMPAIRAWPAPARDMVNIAWPSSASAVPWRLTDASGRLVLAGLRPGTTGALQIALHTLVPGIYVFHADDPRARLGARILVQP